VTRTNDRLRPATRWNRGITLLEILLAVFIFGGAVLTIAATISHDMGSLGRNRVDLVGQDAVRQRLEERRRQTFAQIFGTGAGQIPPGTCRNFTNDAGYSALRNLPYGQGLECAEDFEVNNSGTSPPEVAQSKRLTVVARVLSVPTIDTDPGIHQWRAVTSVYLDGFNRQGP